MRTFLTVYNCFQINLRLNQYHGRISVPYNVFITYFIVRANVMFQTRVRGVDSLSLHINIYLSASKFEWQRFLLRYM